MPSLLANRPDFTTEEDMRQYMDDIRSVPLLSPEQERDLASRCAQGDEDAIREMVASNLRLVVHVAREYAGRGVPLLDLIQEGSIGLIAAAKKFDYTLDYRFSTYATKWIRQGVRKYLQNHLELIRVPGYTAEQLRKVEAARAQLLLELEGEPTALQISEKCGIPAEKVEKLVLLQPKTCSLDAPAGEETAVGNLAEDICAPDPQEALVRRELTGLMDRLMAMLDERQRQVLRLHFGMEDGESHSLDQIGSILGISKERARQIERQAMEKLKKLGADMGLEDFLE